MTKLQQAVLSKDYAALDSMVEELKNKTNHHKAFIYVNPEILLYKKVIIHGNRGSYIGTNDYAYKQFIDRCNKEATVVKLNYKKDCALLSNNISQEWFFVSQLELL